MMELIQLICFGSVTTCYFLLSYKIYNLMTRVEMLEIRLNNNTWKNGKVVVIKDGGGEPGNGGGSVYPEGGINE